MNAQFCIKKICTVLLLLFLAPYARAQYFEEYLSRNIGTTPFSRIKADLDSYYSTHDKGKGSGYKHWKRFEWWAAQHLEPNGRIADAGGRAAALAAAYTSDQDRSTGSWSVIGPTWNQGTGTGLGRPNCIAFNNVNNNLIYVGFPRGGMWAGFINAAGTAATWIPMTDDLATLSISSIATHPTNNSIIYLLTGDGNRGDGFSIGLLRSNDGGNNWQPTGLTFDRSDGQFGFKILINPLRPNTMFVCTNQNVFRSYNGGVTFEAVSSLPGCYDIEYAPGDTTHMVACGYNSLYSSFSAGDVFSNRSTNLPVNCRRTALAVSPNAPAGHVWLYCGGRDSAFVGGAWVGRYKGTYKSTDYGVTYTRINNAPNVSGYNYNGNDFARDQSDIDMDIAVSPTNSNIVMAGTHNVWRSTNAGASYGSNPATHWGPTGGVPYIHEDINFITYNNNDGVLYCGSDGGVYRSSDNGVTWNDISKGLVVSPFYRINVHPTNNDIIVNGAQDAAQNVRVGATSEFKEVSGGDGMSCMIDYLRDDTLYTSYSKDFYRSYDGGASVTNIKPVADNGLWVSPMAMDYTTPSTIFFASATPNQVYRSTNNGTTWSSINGSAQTDLIACPTNANRLYGVTSNVIYRTSNAANASAATVSWTPISTGNTGFPQHLDANTSITRLAVSPSNADQLWFSAGGYNDTLKVYRSNNQGVSWTNMSAGLPNVPVLSIVCASGAAGVNAVYVGTDIGVFYRDDITNVWTPYKNGLPAIPVTDLRLNPGVSKIRAATYGRGIWQSDMYQSCQGTVLVIGTLGGALNYEASSTILATGQLEQGVGSKMLLKSGGYIRLQAGFKVSGGSVMHAKIAPCGSGFENDTFRQPENANRTEPAPKKD